MELEGFTFALVGDVDTLKALAFVSEVAFGTPLSWRDPVRFSYAHGGKDGFPFPVDRATYDSSVRALREAVEAARVGDRERMTALRRLGSYDSPRGGSG